MQQTSKESLEGVIRSMAEAHGLINIEMVEVCRAAGVPKGSFVNVMGETFTSVVARLQAEGVGTHVTEGVTKARVPVSELRRSQLLHAAMRVAESEGYDNLTKPAVAEEARLSPGMVNRLFGTIGGLQEAVMREAVTVGNEIIVAQGLIKNDVIAVGASAALKERAAEFIASR